MLGLSHYSFNIHFLWTICRNGKFQPLVSILKMLEGKRTSGLGRYLWIRVTSVTSMFKVNDLKKLKKPELFKLVANSVKSKNLNLDLAKQTKYQLIETAKELGLCCTVTGQQRNDETDYSVVFTSRELICGDLTDEILRSLNIPSFEDIYMHIRNDDTTSYRCLDRGVKHTSAGDISSINICQVT